MQDVVRLVADGRAAGQARRLVQERLAAWGLTELCDTVVLLASELVTNVLIHTTSAPRLRVTRSGSGVRVGVADDSPVPPAQRRPSQEATTGRGVRLLVELADDWGWQLDGEGGKSVWFVVTGAADPWAPYSVDQWLLDAGP
jgi:anti-sigma regulatory factor (Ser/Thr protein kinase)